MVLPGNGPSDNYGGNSYGAGGTNGVISTPSPADFEDLFGPAGREVKDDPLRHKRHQRWHLPDVLKGTNNFLTDRVDGLISNATDSPFTSSILPYQNVENPDKPLTWEVYSYDEGLASRVPYESAARVLTQSKTSHSAYIVRQGLAISMEHNFMMSERGRRDFNNQLLQLVGSIQYTNDLDVHMALITAPNYERVEAEKYAYSNVDPTTTLRKYVDMFGMCQKNPNGLDILIEDAKQVFKKWGASEPNFMMCNSKIGYQQNMTVEKTQYVTNGIDGIKRLKAGPDLKSYRGLNVINSRHFSIEAGRQPRDLLNRRVRVAEHYKVDAMTPVEMDKTNVMLYDEGKDQMIAISCETLWDASRLDNDKSFKQVLKMQNEMKDTPPAFWINHFFRTPGTTGAPPNSDEKQNSNEQRTLFKQWLRNAPTSADNGMYHPVFQMRLYYTYYTNGSNTIDAAMYAFTAVNNQDLAGIRDMNYEKISAEHMIAIMTLTLQSFPGLTADQMKLAALQLTNWVTFSRIPHTKTHTVPTPYGKCHNSSSIDNDDDIEATLAALNCPEDCLDVYRALLFSIYKSAWIGDGQPSPDEIEKTRGTDGDPDAFGFEEVAFGVFMPYVANTYSKCGSIPDMFAHGFAQEHPPKFTLVVVRPSIEHEMLGLIVGRGGTGELGATLWGQTELSCYDDAMHGKWGMNYKYHARALVFNEKHLIRLWDVAYNGYTGGMGTKLIKWPKKCENDPDYENWCRQSMSLDEPLRNEFYDMFVMRFSHDEVFDQRLTNPVNFHGRPNDAGLINADPDNCVTANMPELNVSGQFGSEANKRRYKQYYGLMPNYTEMHRNRKSAGHSAAEGDSASSCLSYSGTMQLRRKNDNCAFSQSSGTGHLGDSYVGCASIRAGHGSIVSGAPSSYRIM